MKILHLYSKFFIFCSFFMAQCVQGQQNDHTKVVPEKRNESSTISMKCAWSAHIYRPGHVLHLLCPAEQLYEYRRHAIVQQGSMKYKIQGHNETFNLSNCRFHKKYNLYNCTPHISTFNFFLRILIIVPTTYQNDKILYLEYKKAVFERPCFHDNDCKGKNGYSCQNNLCLCPGGTVAPGAFMSPFCRPFKNVGESCVHYVQCIRTAHSTCDQNTRKCICRTSHNFVSNVNGTMRCLPTRQHGDRCKVPNDCQHAQIKNLTCNHNVCVCQNGLKYVFNRGCIVEEHHRAFQIIAIASAPVVIFLVSVIVLLIIKRKCYPQQKCRLSVIKILSKKETKENIDTVKLHSNI